MTPTPDAPDFGVGHGVVWPTQVVAPFVDMTAWTDTNKGELSNSGAAALKKLAQESGVDHFNLAFIQSLGSVKDGKVQWGWGQYQLNEDNKDNPTYHDQYNGIKKSLRELREIGGDAAISFGGASGSPFWATTQDVNVLANTYMELVQGYGLTRLDLDIEGTGPGYDRNVANAKAIKRVQDATGVAVSLTLPVMDIGLTGPEVQTIRAYLEQDVKIDTVNIMAMCYGASVGDYGKASVRAIDNTARQIKDSYKKYAKTELSDAEAFAKVGVTTSIGFESQAHPVFTTDQQRVVVEHARDQKLAMVSFWSMNRDAKLQANTGITKPYEYSTISKLFPGDATVTPSPTPTATPTPTPSPSPTLSPTPTPSPTVAPTPTAPTDDAWQSAKIYLKGDVVTYNGKQYRAKWWTQHNAPDQSSAWEQIVAPNSDGSVDYLPGKAYVAGNIVKYDGHNYKAKWWTTSTPGSDSSWTSLN